MTVQAVLKVGEAQEHLEELLDRVAAGEEILIEDDKGHRVRLVAVPADEEPRRFGQLAGRIVFQPGWEDDVTDDFEDV
jgi:antitoxin (DNA-binding transcriptional repressor) of toxin-antitoxin stability system